MTPFGVFRRNSTSFAGITYEPIVIEVVITALPWPPCWCRVSSRSSSCVRESTSSAQAWTRSPSGVILILRPCLIVSLTPSFSSSERRLRRDNRLGDVQAILRRALRSRAARPSRRFRVMERQLRTEKAHGGGFPIAK